MEAVKNKKVTKAKGILIFIGAFFLIWFLCPIVAGIFNIGNQVGIVVSLCILLSGVFIQKINYIVKILKQKKVAKIMLYVFFTVLIAGILSVGATLGSMIAAQHKTPGENETVIVLGCSVKGDVPSLMLKKRIEAAYGYLEENPQSVAILSGGQGPDEDISEAYCMERELIAMGISQERLIQEDKSTNTYENIRNSKEFIDANELGDKVVIVSSDFHQKRASMIAADFGLEASAVSAKTDIYSVPTFWLRDMFGVVKEFLF